MSRLLLALADWGEYHGGGGGGTGGGKRSCTSIDLCNELKQVEGVAIMVVYQ